eukprot:scaffold2036_cov256-Pinguiococcus_pyrenoidosus.AAC.9
MDGSSAPQLRLVSFHTLERLYMRQRSRTLSSSVSSAKKRGTSTTFPSIAASGKAATPEARPADVAEVAFVGSLARTRSPMSRSCSHTGREASTCFPSPVPASPAGGAGNVPPVLPSCSRISCSETLALKMPSLKTSSALAVSLMSMACRTG